MEEIIKLAKELLLKNKELYTVELSNGTGDRVKLTRNMTEERSSQAGIDHTARMKRPSP